MDAQTKSRQIVTILLAILLWLVTFLLGLEVIYDITELFYLLTRVFGVAASVETTSPVLLCILAFVFLVFIIGTTEYHRKRIGRPESWRLFGLTIAVEVSLLILHYIIF